MDNDYFSIESILAENQKIQCTFKHDIPDMGHLAGGSERDIKALSYGIVDELEIDDIRDWADFNIPPAFGARVRNALKAEARSVRLSGLVGAGGLWYGFGKTIMEILNDDQAHDMSKVLTKTFRDRLVEVIDQAQHFAALGPIGGNAPTGDLSQSFREGLDATERELFALAQESAKRTKRWYDESDKGRR